MHGRRHNLKSSVALACLCLDLSHVTLLLTCGSQYHAFRGGHSNQACAGMHDPMRQRQRGPGLSFAQNMCIECICFGQKTRILHPAGDEMRCQVSDRGTRVNTMRSAVVSRSGNCRDKRLDSPVAGWNRTSVFRTYWRCAPICPEHDPTWTTLPLAKYIVIGRKQPGCMRTAERVSKKGGIFCAHNNH